MAEQLSSGRWLAKRQDSKGFSMKVVDTEEEAIEYETGVH